MSVICQFPERGPDAELLSPPPQASSINREANKGADSILMSLGSPNLIAGNGRLTTDLMVETW